MRVEIQRKFYFCAIKIMNRPNKHDKREKRTDL